MPSQCVQKHLYFTSKINEVKVQPFVEAPESNCLAAHFENEISVS
jgi:hypothetical protein